MKKIGDILITILWGAPNILTLYYLFFYNMGNLSYATLIMTIQTCALNFTILGCLFGDVIIKDKEKK